ncbi:hypothetical protein SEPCBS57363_005868 [Sporothrix epigloea]|uniref:Uncharacterized protein n=1 Tax=Sporothrix epigloea TaxID=1892477 RepID=A0ABP0E311_9PEZI
MPPDATSPVFPDRLIHPLPKRRLRDRLSDDAADLIEYPPDQTPGAPLFYYPYSLKQDAAHAQQKHITDQPIPAVTVFAANPTHTTNATATLSAKQGPLIIRSTQAPARPQRSNSEADSLTAGRTTRALHRPARSAQFLHSPPAQSFWHSPSVTLATDGFDSFEYTSNTKKRKIPSAGDASHTGSCSSTSLPSTTSESSNSSFDSITYSPPSLVDAKPDGFATATAPGISGPGRGRYGRTQRIPTVASARNPFITPANKNVFDGPRKQLSSWPGQSDTVGNSSIISSAIAKAERRASDQQENIKPFSQSAGLEAPQNSLQFTFTCSSKVPGNLLWSGSDSMTSPGSAYWQQGQQQGRSLGGQGIPRSSVSGMSNGSSAGGKSFKGAGSGQSKQEADDRKEAIQLRQELRKQARDRRRNQQKLNSTRPTPEGDIYVCPFCEFENITGHKPRLIYEFEMKERKKRLEMERRQREQRNKEKARNRNRKGSKSAKVGAATAGPSAQQDSLAANEELDDDNGDETGHGTIDDNDYEDDDGAGEADDYVADLRLGIGDDHSLRPRRRRDSKFIQPLPAGSQVEL